VLVVGLIMVIALPPSSPGTPAVAAPHEGISSGDGSSASGAITSDEAQAALSAATASLQAGMGPAAGAPLSCGALGGAVDCQTPSNGSAQIPSILHHADSMAAGGLAKASPLFPTPPSPTPRFGAQASIFLNGSKFGVLLFGGANTSGVLFGDTWQFDVGTHTWWDVSSLACAQACPAARYDGAMAYDYLDGYPVLFGGCGNGTDASLAGVPCPGNGGLLGDTWTYNDSRGGAGHWMELHTPGPVARAGAGLAFDASESSPFLLLFGGYSCLPFGDPFCTWAVLNDWWWFSGGQWFEPSQNQEHPAGRFGMAMVDAGAFEGVILFGGCTAAPSFVDLGCTLGNYMRGDTWQFMDGSWIPLLNGTQINCTAQRLCPSPRFDMGATDYTGPGLGTSVLIYGGLGVGDRVETNSTGGGAWWSFSPPYYAWTEESAPPGYGGVSNGWQGGSETDQLGATWGAAAPPVGRMLPALVGTPYGGLVMFGGESGPGSSLGDTWGANAIDAPPQFIPYSGLIAPYESPAPSTGATMVYDAAAGYAVLFGGCSSNCPNASTWSYAPYSPSSRLQPWQPILPGPEEQVPPARTGASMVYAPLGGGVVLLFGGVTSSTELLNDLWQFSNGSWSEVPVLGTPPPPREQASMVFDSSGGDVLLFGGLGSSGALEDTWLLSYLPFTTGWAWTHVPTTVTPPGRWGSAMADDPTDGVVVLFGGETATGPMNDTWIFAGASWTPCRSESCRFGAPSPRWGAAAYALSSENGVVLFGGCSVSACPMDDTWTFNTSDNGSWGLLRSAGDPGPRFDAVLTFDPAGGYLLLWGGTGQGDGPVGGMGAMFIGGSWVTPTVPLAASLAVSPPPEFGASMVYDSARGVVVLVGGCSSTQVAGGCQEVDPYAPTWLFSNGSWRLDCARCGSPGILSRRFASMAFDPVGNLTILFGGCPNVGRFGEQLCPDPFNDTWTFNGAEWTQVRGTAPPARADAPFAYDPTAQFLLLFGGWAGGSGPVPKLLNDNWSFQEGSWTQFVPSSCTQMPCQGLPQPPPSFGGALFFDPALGLFALYGGSTGSGPTSALWILDPVFGWHSVRGGPVAVYDASAAYVGVLSSIVMVGGILANGATAQTIEILHPTGSWTVASAVPSLATDRWGGSAVYDPRIGPGEALVWYGGAYGPGLPGDEPGGAGTGQGMMWTFAPEVNAWVDVTPFA
jgi:hypothetical protein